MEKDVIYIQLPNDWKEKDAMITAGPYSCLLIFTHQQWSNWLSELSALNSKASAMQLRLFSRHAEYVKIDNKKRIKISEQLKAWIVKDEINNVRGQDFVLGTVGETDTLNGRISCSYIVKYQTRDPGMASADHEDDLDESWEDYLIDNPCGDDFKFNCKSKKKLLYYIKVPLLLIISFIAAVFAFKLYQKKESIDSEILSGIYTIREDERDVIENAAYHDVRMDGKKLNISILPCYLKLNPKSQTYIKLGFLNHDGKTVYTYGKCHVTWGNKLSVGPLETDDKGIINDEEMLPLDQKLTFHFSFEKMKLKITAGGTSNAVWLENEHAIETGEILLIGHASGAENVYENIEGMYAKYENWDRPECTPFLYLNNKRIVTRTTSSCKEDGSFSLEWENVHHNDRGTGFDGFKMLEEPGKVTIDSLISCYPYGFIIKSHSGRIYKYLKTVDRSGVYSFREDDLHDLGHVYNFLPLEDSGLVSKEVREGIAYLKEEVLGIPEKRISCFNLDLGNRAVDIVGSFDGKTCFAQIGENILRYRDERWEIADADKLRLSRYFDRIYIDGDHVIIQSYSNETPVLYLSQDCGESFREIKFSEIEFTSLEYFQAYHGGMVKINGDSMESIWRSNVLNNANVSLKITCNIDKPEKYAVLENGHSNYD